jgi:hypothetical protein
MSYTCKDFGDGMPCNGCHHNPLGVEYGQPTRQTLHPFGCNRAERRAAMRAKKPGFTKGEQMKAWKSSY